MLHSIHRRRQHVLRHEVDVTRPVPLNKAKEKGQNLIVWHQQVPLVIRQVFAKAPVFLCEEQQLWREVLARASFDACGVTGFSKPEEHNRAVSDSRMWFRYEEESVQEVIDLSGFHTKARIFKEAIIDGLAGNETIWMDY